MTPSTVQTGAVTLDADDISDAATTNKYTTQAEIDKLAGIEANAQANAVDSVAGKTGVVTLVKADITDFSDADYATAAQGAAADSATQPGDNVSTLTNDAGYITATLTDEEVQGIVGGMVSGNTESGITVTYQDVDGTIDFAVASQTDNNFTDADHAKLDGIAAGAEVNVDTDLTYTASTRVLASSTGTDATLPEVVAAGDSGLMTGADKTKLDGIATGAEVNTVDSVNAQTGAVVLDTDDISEGTTNLYSQWDDATGGINYAGGNVGVGATSPSEKLTVDGNIFLSTSGQYVKFTAGNSQESGLLAHDSDGNERAGINFQGVSSNQTTAITFSTSDTSVSMAERIRIDKDGNVGIGTSSPTQLLDLASSTGARIAFTDAGTRRWSIGTPAGGSTGFSIHDESGASEAVRITSTGNVGIGTSSPSQELSVSGPAISTTFVGFLISEQTTERLRIGYRTGGPDTGLTCGQIVEDANTLHISGRDTTDGDIIFHAGSGVPERMRIDASNGNVGINVTDPSEKLEIDGTIKATDINFTGLATYADDTAAGAGGLVAGDVYKTSTGELRIKL